jgi:hypothetical protein
VVDPPLQHRRQLRRRRDPVGELVEYERTAPARRPSLRREAGQERAPIAVLDVGEPREPRGDRLGEVPALDVGRRLIGDGIDPDVRLGPDINLLAAARELIGATEQCTPPSAPAPSSSTT